MQPTTPVSPALQSPMPAEQTAKGRLLLVDDDALFRESLGHNLLDEGYDVTSADGGEAALEVRDDAVYFILRHEREQCLVSAGRHFQLDQPDPREGE